MFQTVLREGYQGIGSLAIGLLARLHIVYVSRKTVRKSVTRWIPRTLRRDRLTEERVKTILLDCDGTLWPDEGPGIFMRDINKLELNRNLFIKLTEGYQSIILVTNQSYFARRNNLKYKELTSFFKFYRKVAQELRVDAVLVCLHHPLADNLTLKRECVYRKPHSGLISLANRITKLNLAESALVGDRISDIYAGNLFGIKNCIAVYNEDFFDCNTEMKKLRIQEPLVFSLLQFPVKA